MAEASLRFHRSLYPPACVRQAVAAFSGLGTVRVEENPHDTQVFLSDFPDRLADRLEGEVGNHVLFAAILSARGSA